MSEFQKLRVVTGYEFLKHIRRKRMYIILGVALLVELLVLITVPLLMDGYPDNVMLMSFLLVFGPGMAAIGAVFFAGSAVCAKAVAMMSKFMWIVLFPVTEKKCFTPLWKPVFHYC